MIAPEVAQALDFVLNSAVAMAMLPPDQRDPELAEYLNSGSPEAAIDLATLRAPVPVVRALLLDFKAALREGLKAVEANDETALTKRVRYAVAVADMNEESGDIDDPRFVRELAARWAYNHPDVWGDDRFMQIGDLMFGIEDDTDVIAEITDLDEPDDDDPEQVAS